MMGSEMSMPTLCTVPTSERFHSWQPRSNWKQHTQFKSERRKIESQNSVHSTANMLDSGSAECHTTERTPDAWMREHGGDGGVPRVTHTHVTRGNLFLLATHKYAKLQKVFFLRVLRTLVNPARLKQAHTTRTPICAIVIQKYCPTCSRYMHTYVRTILTWIRLSQQLSAVFSQFENGYVT